MSQFKLTEEIIRRSNSEIWDSAKLEWTLHQVYEAEEPETCLCSHFPIMEICIIRNQLNGQFATVGNCCVKKFIGLPSDRIFQAVKRVRKDNQKSLNIEAIEHAYKNNWINEWEYNFSIDTMRKRSLTNKQLQTRIRINETMLANMKHKSSRS